MSSIRTFIGKLLALLILLCISNAVFSAATNKDSLLSIWEDTQLDARTRILAIEEHRLLYSNISNDSVLLIIGQIGPLVHANKLTDLEGIPLALYATYYLQLSEYTKAFNKIDSAITLFQKTEDINRLARAYANKGIGYRQMGFTNKALHYFELSLKKHQEVNNRNEEGDLLLNIGVLCADLGRFEESINYYEDALVIYNEVDDQIGVVYVYNNSAESYLDQEKYDKAFKTYKKALKTNKIVKASSIDADIYSGISQCYFYENKIDSGIEYAVRAAQIGNENAEPFIVGTILAKLGTALLSKGLFEKAITTCNRALAISDSIGSEFKSKEACHCLYSAHKATKSTDKALHYLDRYLALTQKLEKEEASKSLERFQFEKQALADSLNYEGRLLSLELEHTLENTKKERSRNIAIAVGILVFLLAIGLYTRTRFISKSNEALEKEKQALEKEKQRSDDLLLNILPLEVAEELKENGESAAKHFDQASILFTDFKEFTTASEQLGAVQLVDEINTCFKAFDLICEKYKVEKIKTIGDAYMAAGGLDKSNDSTNRVLMAALEMQSFIKSRFIDNQAQSKYAFQMRLGVHTGPVVAGIVGVKKFQYDIWGDTVNTASRMESHGMVGKVNISNATYELLKDEAQFSFVEREELEVKGKGKMKMWFIEPA